MFVGTAGGQCQVFVTVMVNIIAVQRNVQNFAVRFKWHATLLQMHYDRRVDCLMNVIW